jgi:predicted amidohydrolase
MQVPCSVAAVQMDCKFADKPRNLESIKSRIREASGRGARLIIFPECALTGYCFESRDEAWPFAETLPGASTESLTPLCRELGVWVIYGLLEHDGDRLFNACALVGPKGFVGSYRKVHLPFLGVDRFVRPGDRPFAVHDIDGLRIGILICFDGSFPEAPRVLALLGADLIVLPTNWPAGAWCSAQHAPAVRAMENHVYFAAVNRVGEERGFSFMGYSRIADCNGANLALCEEAHETILYASIDPAAARNKQVVIIPGKYEVNRFAGRRPELYEPIVRREK